MSGSEPASVAGESESLRAAWAGVAAARRGVTVAAISAVINLLVVLAALFVPYIQNRYEDQLREEAYQNAKAGFVDTARDRIIQFQMQIRTLRQSVNRLRGLDANDVASLRLTRDGFQQSRSSVSQGRQMMLSLLESEASDFAFRSAILALLDSHDTVIELYTELVSAVETRAYPAEFLDALDRDIQRYEREEIADINALIAANTASGTGTVLPGPIVFVDCDVERHRNHAACRAGR